MIICSKISSLTEGVVDRHQMVLGDDGQPLGRLGDVGVAKRAELELNDKMETMVAEKDTPFDSAFRAVMDDPKNAALVQCYAGFTQDRYEIEHVEPEMSSQEAELEIDTLARSYMFDHQTDYEAAYRAVLGANPALRASYGQC